MKITITDPLPETCAFCDLLQGSVFTTLEGIFIKTIHSSCGNAVCLEDGKFYVFHGPHKVFVTDAELIVSFSDNRREN